MSRVDLRTAALVALLACMLTAFSSASALASWSIHKTIGAVALSESIPVGVAVDHAHERIYVGTLENRVDKLSFAGAFTAPDRVGGGIYSGVAIDPVNGDLYAVDAATQEIEVLNPESGSAVSSFAVPGSANLLGFYTVAEIASDAAGNVYVPNAPNNEIQVFAATGGPPSGGVDGTIEGEGEHALKAPEGVAVGPTGDIWVADTGGERLEEFEPDGAFVREIPKVADVQAVAVDSSGDVFASIGGAAAHVVEYGPSGTPIAGAEKIGEGLLSVSAYKTLDGVAVDRASEVLYVVDGGGNVIQQFSEWALTTKPVSNVSPGSATLNGEIEVAAGGSIAACRFEYGPTTAYGSTVPCEKPSGGGGPYTASTAVSATVSGLTGDTHDRISITNAKGEYTKFGEDEAFGPPAIAGETAEAAVTTATPRAHVTLVMEGESTCEAQYVSEAEYAASGYTNAKSSPCTAPIGKTPGAYEVETGRLDGLQPDTVYRYRFLATSQAGTATGPDEELTTFGIAPGSFALDALGQAGEQIAQAGAHPYQLIDRFKLNTSSQRFANGTTDSVAPDANAKDVITELPPGLIGNPDAVPKCEPYDVERNECSGATQVGVIKVSTANPGTAESEGKLSEHEVAPIYNLVPPKGVAAQFGANVANFAEVHIDARVRAGGDYGVTVEVLNSSAEEGLVAAEVTLWGVPAAESHDAERFCPQPREGGERHLGEEGLYKEHACTERGPQAPFLTNPTACTGERSATMRVDSWQDPSVFVDGEAKLPAIGGCGNVPFAPSLAVQPSSTASDSPTGLHIELTVPQNESPTKLAEADLKDAEVTLPAGVTVNPAAANGLVGCPLLSGKEDHAGESGIDLENSEPANCPNAAKVGTVKIKTPLLEEELEGGVYAAQQSANPFKSLLALYIAAEAPERGVMVKLAGQVELNEKTGQLTTSFDESPQLPFEVLKLDFFGGERALLATPPTCGSYQPSGLLEPWSRQGASGEEGTANAEPFIRPFEITSGPAGAACSGLSFAPAFEAGMTDNQAGAFGSFALTLARQDGEQRLSAVSLKMPPGVEALLSKVTPCANAQAEAGECPAASKIGHVVVQAGVGSEPIVLPEAGKPEDPVFLTEKYDGAPFGLSIVAPAEAGPFDLGTVIVRSKIELDPTTGQISVISDPLPTILQGIPVDIRAIHVEIDKPGFTFNPTSCEPTMVSGTIDSTEGASASVSTRFQAAGCRELAFKPRFSAAIHADHSKGGGEYLHVTVQTAAGEANVEKVHVTLPSKLPARLETLKLACTEAQFAANPAGCPAGSFVGTATAQTPVLPVPLTGPAIFVSHGGSGFPNLDLVLQGDGVTVNLVGDTFIDSKSITSSTFASVPDVPISQVDVVLPAGPNSALGGNGNMCSEPLYMPTVLTGHNGAVTTQKTKIEVEGCKPEVRIVWHVVRGPRAYIHVNVPSAGTLTASGSNVVGMRKQARAGGASVAVQLSSHAESLLASHPGRRLQVTVHLRFVPRHGKAISTSVVLLLG